MKIGIDGRALLTARTATLRNYVYSLVTALDPLPAADMTLFFPSSPGELFNRNKHTQCKMVRWPFLGWMTGLWEEAQLPEAVEQDHIHVYHGPDHHVPKKLHCPSVVTVHDLGFKKFPRLVPSAQRRRLELCVGQAVERATLVVAVSNAVRMDLMDLYGVKTEKIRMVYPGFDKSVAVGEAQVEATRQTYGICKPYILFAGTIEPRKNLCNLIQSFARKFFVNDFQLVVAGARGWACDDVFDMVRKLRLQEKVIFTGRVTHGELKGLYRGAELFVYPGLYEGFGYTVLEAMSCGVPVVASNNSALRELFEDSAILVDPLEPGSIVSGMQDALFSPSRRKDLIRAGSACAQRFDWKVMAEQMLDVYRSV